MARAIRTSGGSRRSLMNRLSDLRSQRLALAHLERSIPEIQALAIEMLDGVDPDGKGFKYTEDDPEGKNYAFVQRNSGTQVWDEEALVAWLHENGHWTTCSTRVLDVHKVEALVKDQDLSPVAKRSLLGFVQESTPPKPFIRFGKEEKKR